LVVGVVVEVHLRDERRDVEGALVPTGVGLEDDTLGLRDCCTIG
jgi:hypothetical protein